VADARRELDATDRRQMQILAYLNGGFSEVEAKLFTIVHKPAGSPELIH
jgi:hypothetical protein